jgi:hypothetical protein
MQSRPKRCAPILITAVALLIGGCSSSGDSSLESETVTDGQSDSDVTVVTVAPAGPSTSSSSSSSSTTMTTEPRSTTFNPVRAVASPEAEAFKELTPQLEGVGGGVAGFAQLVEPVRVDELAAEACATVTGDMTDSQLGLAGLAAYSGLTMQEKQQVIQTDWVVFYGALVGFFCPENLPSIDLDGAPPVEGSSIEQFRAVVSQIDGVSTEAAGFVTGLTDERLDELQILACRDSSSDMSTEDFGLAIVSSYGNDLSEAEGAALSLSAFSELYGALVGWFCPANLPL